jgi:hypothetical protein
LLPCKAEEEEDPSVPSFLMLLLPLSSFPGKEEEAIRPSAAAAAPEQEVGLGLTVSSAKECVSGNDSKHPICSNST